MEELELDERKTKILNAIIRNYLETGEPVGSEACTDSVKKPNVSTVSTFFKKYIFFSLIEKE